MGIVSVCQEMGWTYLEYMSQPSWFLELLMDKMQIDIKRVNQEITRQKFASKK